MPVLLEAAGCLVKLRTAANSREAADRVSELGNLSVKSAVEVTNFLPFFAQSLPFCGSIRKVFDNSDHGRRRDPFHAGGFGRPDRCDSFQ